MFRRWRWPVSASTGFATGSPSTVGYVSSVIVIGAAIVWLRRAALPGLLAAGLAIAAVATLAHHGAHAGGYWNTGWDLVCNFIGASAAGLVIARSRAGAA